jgi:hypothetical protein
VGHQISVSQPELYQWIITHGKVVDQKLWQEATTDTANNLQTSPMGFHQMNQLYDLNPN